MTDRTAPMPDRPAPRTRDDLRNVAIVAHVDHGKTTLVDAMLRQTGAFRANQVVVDRVMDSGDLEREKGITILAKQTDDRLRRRPPEHRRHARPRRLRRRGRAQPADGRLACCCSSTPPRARCRRPATCSRRRWRAACRSSWRSTRSTARDARPAEVLDDVYELFIDLGADEHQIDFPVVYTNAKPGTATPRPRRARAPTSARCSTCSSSVTPPPTYEPDHPLQLLVTNLSANDYVGRMAVGRIWNGTIRMGQRITVVREEADDTAGTRRARPDRDADRHGDQPADRARASSASTSTEAGPGDIVAVAGLPEVTIGDTITDPADPRPLPRLDVDEPTLRMTFGVNTSPLSGREGKYVTSRQIKARLDREVLGNVSIEVRPTESPDTFEVRGRGELQLAVLIEQMRREGFELPCRGPEVLLREVDGEVQEPYERITIDIPPDFIGAVQAALAGRKGRLEQMTHRRRRPRPDGVRPARPRAWSAIAASS